MKATRATSLFPEGVARSVFRVKQRVRQPQHHSHLSVVISECGVVIEFDFADFKASGGLDCVTGARSPSDGFASTAFETNNRHHFSIVSLPVHDFAPMVKGAVAKQCIATRGTRALRASSDRTVTTVVTSLISITVIEHFLPEPIRPVQGQSEDEPPKHVSVCMQSCVQVGGGQRHETMYWALGACAGKSVGRMPQALMEAGHTVFPTWKGHQEVCNATAVRQLDLLIPRHYHAFLDFVPIRLFQVKNLHTGRSTPWCRVAVSCQPRQGNR